MDRIEDNNGFCTVRIMAESPAAAEFGQEVRGRVLGREHIEVTEDYLKDLYPDEKEMDVLSVEDENGRTCHIPEKAVERVLC